MQTNPNKTFSANGALVEKNWFLVDAADKTLGRLATELASRLRGKHKAEFTPNADTGDYIVVINAAKVRVTGNKYNDKMYYRHTGYVGNLKSTSFKDMQAKKPEDIIITAVKGMLPKGPLGRAMLKKMKVYAEETHNNEAQQPQVLDI